MTEGKRSSEAENPSMRAPYADKGFFVSRWYSFCAALSGARFTLETQLNAWIELAAVATVIVAGLLLRISAIEWAVVALTLGVVLALEAVNTAVEATVDLISPEYHPLAKIAKDAASGALLFAVLGSLGVAVAIFGPHLWRLLR